MRKLKLNSLYVLLSGEIAFLNSLPPSTHDVKYNSQQQRMLDAMFYKYFGNLHEDEQKKLLNAAKEERFPGGQIKKTRDLYRAILEGLAKYSGEGAPAAIIRGSEITAEDIYTALVQTCPVLFVRLIRMAYYMTDDNGVQVDLLPEPIVSPAINITTLDGATTITHQDDSGSLHAMTHEEQPDVTSETISEVIVRRWHALNLFSTQENFDFVSRICHEQLVSKVSVDGAFDDAFVDCEIVAALRRIGLYALADQVINRQNEDKGEVGEGNTLDDMIDAQLEAAGIQRGDLRHDDAFLYVQAAAINHTFTTTDDLINTINKATNDFLISGDVRAEA